MAPTSTPDFFHPINSTGNTGGLSSVPLNIRGYQEPASGEGYVGMRVFPRDGGLEEYLAVELSERLGSGAFYEVQFKVNLSNESQFTSDDIGVAFLSEHPSTIDLEKETTYHLKNKEGRFITDTVGWTTVKAYYQATGEENYLVIGNFIPKKV